jgi:hypothetical protein
MMWAHQGWRVLSIVGLMVFWIIAIVFLATWELLKAVLFVMFVVSLCETPMRSRVRARL